MSAAWRWARCDMRRRWLSVGALALLVALATGSTLALAAGARRAGSAVDRFVTATELPAISIFTSSDPSPALMDALQTDDRITGVERTDAPVVVPEPMTGGAQALTMIASDDNPTVVGHAMVVEGRGLTPGAAEEILVNERAAHDFGLRAGQRVPLRSLGCVAACPPEPAGDATIAGIVRLPPDLTHDPTSAAVSLAGPNFIDGRWKSALRPGVLLWLHVRDRADTPALVADLSPLVGDGEITNGLLLMQVAGRAARLQREALMVAAFAVAVAGLLVLGQALARHLGGRADDSPGLAAMGLETHLRHVAALMAVLPALVLGLAGGVVVAIAMSPVYPLGAARRADPNPGLHADAVAIGLGVAVAAVVLAGVALVVTARWARASVEPPAGNRVSRPTRAVVALGLGPVAATGSRYALERGHGQARLPITATLVALVVATAALCGALVTRWSMDGLVAHARRYGQPWSLVVGTQQGDIGALARSLSDDPRVASVALAAQGGVVLGATHMTAIGLAGVDRAAPVTVLDGRAPARPDEIALGSASLHSLGRQVGDRVTAAGACGARDVTIVGRVVMPLVGTSDPDDGALVPLDTFRAICSDQLVAAIDSNTSALVELHHEQDAAAVRQSLDPQQYLVQSRFVPGSVTAIEEIRQVPIVVAALVGLLALAAIGHALALAVRRRRHDLVVLRALGLRPRQTAGVVRWQATTLTTVAAVVGIPMGLVGARLLWMDIAESSHLLVHTDVRVLGLAALAVTMFATALVMAWWPGRRASHLRPADVLRGE